MIMSVKIVIIALDGLCDMSVAELNKIKPHKSVWQFIRIDGPRNVWNLSPQCQRELLLICTGDSVSVRTSQGKRCTK